MNTGAIIVFILSDTAQDKPYEFPPTSSAIKAAMMKMRVRADDDSAIDVKT